MAAYINLSLQVIPGTFYFAAHRSAEDDAMLQLYSSRLVGVARESTFDVWYSQVARDWQQRDDLTPFNDRRWTHVGAVWTFDLDRDILRLDQRDRNLWVPLNLVRQRSITISDFEPCEPPSTLAKHALQSIYSARRPAAFWKMRRKNVDLPRLQRRKAFVFRILADFAFQWRHVLCGRYNNFTFRRLANAIVRIVTLDFTVEEATIARQGIGRYLHTPHAITPIRNDFGKQIVSTPGSAENTSTYLILSVRELILFQISSEFEKYTEPMRLFDGIHPPSDETIELLLQATQTSAFTAPLHKLPIELQDAILDKVSAGPIESARVGCLLDAGSVFTWKYNNRNIEREVGRRSRTPWAPVESHVWFGGYPSGIAYK
ncbi:hypothetical protein BKA58DRAFT_451489 [Alternaria rosae]|uniref:uncharacterized protein n=1 Tax=Alternaria rosae TaxID=1187941 RepID=UPI001E8DCC17|nr:uncharacterized protein BKA58DRAFT_451489 [Alternaria rosae]KAH6877671.1 hypothetical protein BKA58DRAFT_451489 [Alternaria rosae]